MIHTLLSGREAQLDRLTIKRIQIRRDEIEPTHFELHGVEGCLYPLTGSAVVNDNAGTRCGVGRRKPIESEGVRKGSIECVRWPADSGVKVAVTRTGDYAFDAMMITYRPKDFIVDKPPNYQTGGYRNEVGRGAYYREVREIVPPDGFRIHVGETYSPGTNDDPKVPDGVWSSWPPHATPEETREQYEHHEEVMFFLMPRDHYGIVKLNGKYVSGDRAKGLMEVRNGLVTSMPTGRHEIVSGPALPGQGWLYYFWAYVSFLRKTYNQYADDTGTYLK